jgi:DNA-binding transcriptional regulator YbjK
MVENVLPDLGEEDPIPGRPKIAAYWAAIQRHPTADRVLAEMRRGLEARRHAVLEAEASSALAVISYPAVASRGVVSGRPQSSEAIRPRNRGSFGST